MDHKKRLENNIRVYYIYKFFRQFVLWLPIWVLFFIENGLSMTQVMFLGAILLFTQQALEIPSGIFADLYGRKRSLMLAAVFYFLCAITFSIGDSFIDFLIGELFLGISFAFASGANQALAYDSLYELGKKDRFMKVESNAFFIHNFAFSIASILGGLIAVYGLRLSFQATLIPSFILILISFLFYEPKHHKKVSEGTYLSHFKESFRFAYDNKKVFSLIIFFGLNLSSAVLFFNFLQLYLKDLGFGPDMIGYTYAFFLMIAAIVSKYTSEIESFIGEKLSILIIPLNAIIGLFFLIFGNLSGLIGVMLFEMNWGFIMPLTSSYINNHIPSKYRATIISINGFFFGLIMIMLGPILGNIIDRLSLQIGLVGLLILSFFGLFFTINLAKNGGIKNETR